MCESAQDISSQEIVVNIDQVQDAAPIGTQSSIQQELEDLTATPLMSLMVAAAREGKPVRSCAPAVALCGFGGVVDDAYQASLTTSRVWGCLTASLINLVGCSVVSLRRLNGNGYADAESVTYVVSIVLTIIAGLPCLAVPWIRQILSRAVANRIIIQWFAEGLGALSNLSYALLLISCLRKSDTGSLAQTANLYLLCGLGAVMAPILTMVMLKTTMQQSLAWGAVYPAVLASSPFCNAELNTHLFLLIYFFLLATSMLWVDQASRGQFLSELRVVAGDLRTQVEMRAANEADESANKAINHCGKRVMYNNLQWIDSVDGRVMPHLRSGDPARIAKATSNLELIMPAMKAENKKGFNKCKTVIALKQIASNTYVPILESIHTQDWLKEKAEMPNLTMCVSDDVPEYICLPKVTTEIILDNAISNAVTHGSQGGQITMNVEIVDGDSLLISLSNKPGPRHKAARNMQKEHGENAVLNNRDGLDMASIAAASSTLCGGNEMVGAAAAGNQEISLVFETDAVVFSLRMKLVRGSAAESLNTDLITLKPNDILICADDDRAARMSYKPLAKKLGVGQDRLMVLGETFEEVAGLKDTILKAAEEHGADKIVCIIDQNMDNYRCKRKVLGTDVVRELRVAGFKGVVLIRSANDDFASVLSYRQAGADGAMDKLGKVSVLAAEVVRQCNLAWEMGVCDPAVK